METRTFNFNLESTKNKLVIDMQEKKYTCCLESAFDKCFKNLRITPILQVLRTFSSKCDTCKVVVTPGYSVRCNMLSQI